MIGLVGNDVISKAASDYARALEGSTVGGLVFPTEMVSDATGKIPRLPKNSLQTIPDSALATSVSAVPKASVNLDTVSYACEKHGYADDIALSDIEKARGAFPDIIQYTIQRLMLQLSFGKEKRIATLLNGIPNAQKTALAGDGVAEGNKWSLTGTWAASGGQPVQVISEASAGMPLPANTLIVPRAVYEQIRFNDDFLNALPNITYKSMTPEMLASVLQLDRVLVPNVNTRASAQGVLSDPWGKSVYLLHVASDRLLPTVGRTLINQFADGAVDGYIAREYIDETKGIKGVRTYSVASEVDEVLVNAELAHVFTNVI